MNHKRSTDTATYRFPTSQAAWSFMRACDGAGLKAGFPSLDGFNAVEVGIETWMAHESADRLAGVPCAEYHFAGEEYAR